jgi:hypothetical protein
MTKQITVDELKNLLDYCPESGIFRWKVSNKNVKLGQVAGCSTDGRILIGINKSLYKAHRLAWLYVYGELPDLQIDHIDGNEANNRIANLRLATNAENGQNKKKARRDSQTGLIGVTLHKRSGLFRATIQVEGKRQSLGYYKTAEEAHQAYLKKKREIHKFNTL